MNRFFLAGLSLFFATWTLSSAQAKCIGLITAGWHHNFWHSLVEGGQEAARELGQKLVFRAPRQEGETAQQIKLMLSIRKYGCNAFVIAPVDRSINALVNNWDRDNVPTIYVDRPAFGQSRITSLVMTNNYQAGRDAARELDAILPPDAVIALLGLQKGVTSTDARENGFRDFMIEKGRPIQIEAYLGTTHEEALWRAQELFGQYEGPPINGVFTSNESTTEGVIEALSILTQDRPIHVGFDDSPKIRAAIKNEALFGAVIQDPYQMGYQSVMLANRIRQGEPVPSRVFTGHTFLNMANLEVF
ncbi:substrate-binding domain-containing protein [Aestuariispira insulae]|uniref:Monosaccharide ABC transporter substrate-binding protein (CUT2 family) n=1 Tax=Aestuariispira insulae TaxID=1461337 RepID=A0A3D9HRJ1_9PROT|nr:substrate-binding domain-containing protein [Aestuariispira insulae]RED52108.1 monosaccharide ABC transporter substrate-binding protein (CUT2 family) [Aestuariispira insulae]